MLTVELYHGFISFIFSCVAEPSVWAIHGVAEPEAPVPLIGLPSELEAVAHVPDHEWGTVAG